MKDYTLEEQYSLITSNPTNLHMIANPFEEILFEAVRMAPFVIGYVDSPSEELITFAIKLNPYVEQFVKREE